jgi:hypothetical protein
MKLLASFLIAVIACVPLSAADTLSPRFRTVYVLEMADGLDQYLSSRLTANRVLWVVLEPTSADAVLTQSLDENFWNWLAHNYPPAAGAPVSTRAPLATSSRSNSRQPGMVFLVDPRTRVVLWSFWISPKKPTPDELNHNAELIAAQLKGIVAK